jgi:chemotaxis protein CheD
MEAKRKNEPITEVVLHPGDFYFGSGYKRVRTLLGSCVSIVLWHPKRRIGGMCHYLLPVCNKPYKARTALDGHYADDAIALFLRELRISRSKAPDYVVKLFGGGSMFPEHSRARACGLSECTDEHRIRCGDVACKNVQVGRELLSASGFAVASEHVGGVGYRQVIFELWNGDVWLRRGRPLPAREKTR